MLPCENLISLFVLEKEHVNEHDEGVEQDPKTGKDDVETYDDALVDDNADTDKA